MRGVLPETSLLRGPVNPSLNDEAGALVADEIALLTMAAHAADRVVAALGRP